MKKVTVLDPFERPIENVHITLANGKVLGITLPDGTTTIEAADNDLIRFSHVSFEVLEIPFRNISQTIILNEKINDLGEVVIRAPKKKTLATVIGLSLITLVAIKLIMTQKPKEITI